MQVYPQHMKSTTKATAKRKGKDSGPGGQGTNKRHGPAGSGMKGSGGGRGFGHIGAMMGGRAK